MIEITGPFMMSKVGAVVAPDTERRLFWETHVLRQAPLVFAVGETDFRFSYFSAGQVAEVTQMAPGG